MINENSTIDEMVAEVGKISTEIEENKSSLDLFLKVFDIDTSNTTKLSESIGLVGTIDPGTPMKIVENLQVSSSSVLFNCLNPGQTHNSYYVDVICEFKPKYFIVFSTDSKSGISMQVTSGFIGDEWNPDGIIVSTLIEKGVSAQATIPIKFDYVVNNTSYYRIPVFKNNNYKTYKAIVFG